MLQRALQEYQITAPHFTSIGDMTRLNMFERFKPSSENDVLTIEDLDNSSLFQNPSILYSFFEYDGIFRLRCQAGGEYMTQEQIELHADLVKQWFDDVVWGDACEHLSYDGKDCAFCWDKRA